MKISRFFGITTREAMRQVRLALGPDALIVSNRRVDGGVEILATDSSDIPEAEERSPVAPASRAPQFQQPQQGAMPAHAPQVPAAPGSPGATGSPAVAGDGRPPLPSPMSPLGAYAAAFQAAYGPGAVDTATGTPTAVSTAHVPAPTTIAPSAPPPAQVQPQVEVPPVSAQPQPTWQAVPPAPPSPVAPSTAAATAGPAQPDIMNVIGDMRGALESRIDELLWGNQLRRAPQAANLFQTMLGFGFSTALLRAMLKRLPEDASSRGALQWVRDELVSHLPMLPSEDALWKPGLVLALVGPTGVGKTTTIAKLAARCVRRFGPDKLVLITTDTYRIGAHEQLKIYGQMLRVPVHVVRSADELHDIVAGIRPDQVILIDNVGISQRDRYIHEQAALLASAGREVTRLLALNAASHGETLDEVARSYAADGGPPLKGCIITKVDEATRLGAALDTALRYRLPIHYVSIGQKVPEHLVFLTATELVDRALTAQPSSRSLYAPTEADFAALLSMTRPAPAAASDAQASRQRMQALPRLLSMTAGGAAHLSEEDLRAGCQYIDELDSVSEAYDLWRALVSGPNGKEAKPASSPNMLRAVQNAWSASGHKSVLAVHDHVAVRVVGEPATQLRATLMLDQHGAALASTMQQLSLPHGWLSSCGLAQAQAPAARDALLHQIRWLAENAADLPLVHLFEGGNASLWRELARLDHLWMAQVPAITRVAMEDGATTVQALAKTLAHHPVADPDYLFAMSDVAGAKASERALWVASSAVHIASRGRESLPLQMVSALLVDRSTGKRVRQLIGLHPGLAFSTEKLAGWLVIKAESREATRHAAKAWQLLSTRDSGADVQDKALVAVQTGLAAWELQKNPLAEAGRELAATMLGRKRLPVNAAAAATLKLFALKEMMGI